MASFASSYIPTTTAAATRAADVASISGSNFSSWHNATEGTIFSDHLSGGVPGITFVGQLGESLSNYYDVARYQTVLRTFVAAGGATQAALNTALTTGTRHRTALGVKQDDFAFAADGLTPITDTSGTMPSGLTNLTIGNDLSQTAGRQINGTIKRLTYWPIRLGDNVLQTITQ